MSKRKAISKKRRFEIFKRDSFTCQYCGSKPPKTILELDHIMPVSKGGNNGTNNLITSCFDCNRGKSDRLLTNIPDSLQTKADVLKEKRDQLKAYNKLSESIELEFNIQIEKINRAYMEMNEGWELSEKFKQGTVRKFLKELDFDTVLDAMYSACAKIYDGNKCLRYFCGICWNKTRNDENKWF